MRQIGRVKSFVRFTVCMMLFGTALITARAGFNSLYVFGDGLSTTTNNIQSFPLSTNYYGYRYSNGRVWVEVLAQRQGILYESNKNWSYFDCGSGDVVTNVGLFNPPASATNALFVVWVNNVDLYDEALKNNTDLAEWTGAINRSQTNHLKAITNLYFAKGMRTLIAPNAADISKVPFFNADARTNFIRQRCIDYNVAFSNTISRARVLCPNLKIYVPDIFALVDDVLAHAANYGLTNSLKSGLSIDALSDPALLNVSPNGPGASHIFWDYLDPSARFHAVIADVAQQMISPVQLAGLVPVNTSNRLDILSVPVGLGGTVLFATNLVPTNWLTNSTFSSLTVTQSVFVSPTNSQRFYRLKFPWQWTWP